MWTFIVSDRRFGEKKIVSANYDEAYIISPRGSWVPEGDVEYLTSIRWYCPGCEKRVQAFSAGNPTRRDMSSMPDRPPKEFPEPEIAPEEEMEDLDNGDVLYTSCTDD